MLAELVRKRCFTLARRAEEDHEAPRLEATAERLIEPREARGRRFALLGDALPVGRRQLRLCGGLRLCSAAGRHVGELLQRSASFAGQLGRIAERIQLARGQRGTREADLRRRVGLEGIQTAPERRLCLVVEGSPFVAGVLVLRGMLMCGVVGSLCHGLQPLPFRPGRCFEAPGRVLSWDGTTAPPSLCFLRAAHGVSNVRVARFSLLDY